MTIFVSATWRREGCLQVRGGCFSEAPQLEVPQPTQPCGCGSAGRGKSDAVGFWPALLPHFTEVAGGSSETTSGFLHHETCESFDSQLLPNGDAQLCLPSPIHHTPLTLFSSDGTRAGALPVRVQSWWNPGCCFFSIIVRACPRAPHTLLFPLVVPGPGEGWREEGRQQAAAPPSADGPQLQGPASRAGWMLGQRVLAPPASQCPPWGGSGILDLLGQ